MTIHSLSLTNFRNHSKARFEFDPQTTLIAGPNGSGKTNLLEAIYFLAAGRSFRARYDREAIVHGESILHLAGVVDEGGRESATLELSVIASEHWQNAALKQYKINGVKKRLSDFAGTFNAVVFSPEEIELITGNPARRRKYLDSALTQTDKAYARNLAEYEKVRRQRNRLLLLIREGEQKRETLQLWDERLVRNAALLHQERAQFFSAINRTLADQGLLLEYLPKSVSLDSLRELVDREIAAGQTLRGPHRDDFIFQSNSENLSTYGSRGEQRLAVFHLKLAELEFMTQKKGERPLLLLDDIFSELDEQNRQSVTALLGKQQTVITSAENLPLTNYPIQSRIRI